MPLIDYWIKAFKRTWIWFLLSAFFQFFSSEVQKQMMEKQDSITIFWGLFIFGCALLFSTVGILVVNHVLSDIDQNKKTPLFHGVSENFKYAMIESLRALKPIALKSLLLLIPGLIEAIKLYWIPFIVQFVPEYKKGQVDALQASRDFVKGRFLKVFFLLSFTFLLGIVPHALLGTGGKFSEIGKLTLFIFSSISLELLGDILIYRFYMRNSHGA